MKGQGKGAPGGKRGVLILKVCKKLAEVGGLGRLAGGSAITAGPGRQTTVVPEAGSPGAGC